MSIFRKSVKKNSSIMSILQEYPYAFLLSGLFLPRMRTDPEDVRIENQNTHLIFHNFFSKIMPFMRKY